MLGLTNMDNFGIIYKATNVINGKIYIGQTVQRLHVRIRDHINTALTNHSNIYFHNAIRKYGKENFEWEIIECCDSKEELDEIEFHYIKQYNSFENGYNLTMGGEGSFGYTHSDKIKNKMSNASLRSNKHVNRGKHLSKEWRHNIALSNTGRKWSNKQRINFSKSRKNKFTGKDSKCAKKFIITKPNGISFVIYGLADFSRKYKNGLLDFRLLSAVAVGKRNHHKGYKCRYYDEDVDVNLPLWEITNA